MAASLKDKRQLMKKISIINYKPYLAYVLAIILVFVMCIPLYKPLGIVAMVILTVAICHFVMTKDKPTIAVYDNGIVIYDPRNKNKGRFIEKEKILIQKRIFQLFSSTNLYFFALEKLFFYSY